MAPQVPVQIHRPTQLHPVQAGPPVPHGPSLTSRGLAIPQLPHQDPWIPVPGPPVLRCQLAPVCA